MHARRQRGASRRAAHPHPRRAPRTAATAGSNSPACASTHSASASRVLSVTAVSFFFLARSTSLPSSAITLPLPLSPSSAPVPPRAGEASRLAVPAAAAAASRAALTSAAAAACSWPAWYSTLSTPFSSAATSSVVRPSSFSAWQAVCG